MATLTDLPANIAGPLAHYYTYGGRDYQAEERGMPSPYTDQKSFEDWYRAQYGDPGELAKLVYDDSSAGGYGGWQIDPKFGMTPDQTQIKVEQYDPNSGAYVVKLKTADKEGTLYAYQPDGQGGYMLNQTPLGTVEWDTNTTPLKDPKFLAMLAAVVTMGVGAYFAPATAGAGAGGWAAPGAFLGEDLAAAIAAGSTVPAGYTIPAAFSAAANAGVSAAEFAAADAAQLAAQGLGETQIAQVLTSTGLDPFIAADAAQLAAQGLNEAAIIQNITASYGTQLTGGAGAYMPGGGAYGYAPGVGTTFNEAGQVINLRDTPGWNAPPESPGPGDGIDNAGPPTPPGDPSKLPKIPGTPGGGRRNPGDLVDDGQGIDWLSLLLSGADARNKYNLGKDQMEFFNNWANKIFGKSADFENMLMNTYTDPASYYKGPEGQALADTSANRLLRQDFSRGVGSNSTNRERLFNNDMLLGLDRYRGGLTSAANIGRSQSGQAMRGAGEAFQGFADSRNWYSPFTYNAGQKSGGRNISLRDIWNTGKDIWNTGKDIWNTGKGFWDWLNG